MSLAAGIEQAILFFVQDGRGSETDATTGVRVIDVGPPQRGRLARMTLGSWRMWRAVWATRPRVAHFHDPELIPVGLALKAAGVRVIYDVHEDVPRHILSKDWMVRWLRPPVAAIATVAEWIASLAFDNIVAATPSIAARFPDGKTVLVQNFPLLEELYTAEAAPYSERPRQAIYVGGITRVRGACEMVAAVGLVPPGYGLRLVLGGQVSPAALRGELEALSGWSRTETVGFLQRPAFGRLLYEARAGLVLFHPAPNHINAQPNKLFEYMSAGLPVIASDFPLWRQIVEDAGCGLLVNPLDPSAIAEAMVWMLEHPEEAEAMGRAGRSAVESRFNWQHEAWRLVELYQELLHR